MSSTKAGIIPKISIIIVNYRSWAPLKECLESILTLENEAFDYEVIIVDNYSDDGKLAEFSQRFPSFRFIENKGNYGFSNGNNLGAGHASGDYLLFLNPDIVVSQKPIVSLLDYAAKHPQFAVFSLQHKTLSGKMENPFGVFPSLFTINSIIKSMYVRLSGKNLKNKCFQEKVIFPDWVSGSCVFMRSDVFKKIGGWDEDFWLYSEDVDICKRAGDRCGGAVLLCDQHIIHKHGGSTRVNIKKAAFFKAHVIISMHIYFRKHYSGIHHFLLQSIYVFNILLIESLIPAIAGLVFFPVGTLRRYPMIYVNLLKYYFHSLKRGSWLFDTRNIRIPGEKKR